ncbi:dopamine receptor 1 [Tetranychus urticae]|uniref:G-protein coupled receptors family 1 profile domain-containing protein n=1 Tax=Tetranychus urticae TaxID=32264 RepID=T1JVR1_TETUR|nr:dopamine receptor 1 [Tetranychus urticae]
MNTSFTNYTLYQPDSNNPLTLVEDEPDLGIHYETSSNGRHQPYAQDCNNGFTAMLTKYAVNSTLIIIILASVFGNVLVCIAIYTDRRLRKLSNLFLVSLALADLFVGSLVMTLELTNNLMGHWIFGQRACEIWISFDIMCCTASILNLCAISLDRFLHIKDPLRYNQWMTKRVVLASIGLIWLLSGLISFVPVSLGWHKPSDSLDNLNIETFSSLPPPPSSSLSPLSSLQQHKMLLTTTTPSIVLKPSSTVNETQQLLPDEYQCALDLTPLYALVSSTISFYLPCLIMIALYTRLYLYARKHVQHIRSMAKPLHFDPGDRSSGSSSARSSSHHSHNSVMDHKAAITLGVIMGVFLICWVPFFCMNIIAAFCKTCIPELLFRVITWLGWFNSALNPVIYSIFNTEFREAFRKILLTVRDNDWCRSLCKKSDLSTRHDNGHSTGRYLSSHPRMDNSDMPTTGAYGVKMMSSGFQGSSKCAALLTCKSVEVSSKVKAYMDIIPIKDNIEIICDSSTGKISAI